MSADSARLVALVARCLASTALHLSKDGAHYYYSHTSSPG